jgi:hypothetical protein
MDFLFKLLPDWQSVGIIVVGLMSLTSLIGVFRGRIDSPWGTVDFSGKKTRQLPRHASCIDVHDILDLMARQIELDSERERLRRDAKKEQRRLFISFELGLRGTIMGDFARYLRGIIPDVDVERHHDYVAYLAAVVSTGREMREYYEVALDENHFAERGDNEWFMYTKQKSNEIRTIIASCLHRYYGGLTVKLVHIDEYDLSRIGGEMLDIISAVFDEARLLAINAEAKDKKLVADHKAWVERNITGPRK